MDAKDQITHCAGQIEKLNAERSYEDMVALLGDLDSSLVTVELLQATDVVKILYRVLKTCSDAHVKKLIKGILSKWKKTYSQGYRSETLSPRHCVAAQTMVSDASGQVDSELDSSRTDAHQGCPSEGGSKRPGWLHAKDEVLTPRTDSPHQAPPENTHPTPTPGDTRTPPADFPAVRSKCLQLLLAALGSLGPPEEPNEEEEERRRRRLAVDIEHHIHAIHASSELKYKACVRSRVANLRNPKSGHLRRGLLDGSLPPRALAHMTSEEMAGPDLRRLRREYAARAVSEHQLPRAPEGTPTRKVRCRRCGASDCRVSQVSRGALFLPGWAKPGGPDHDGVTFVTCSVCGAQWYHSGWVCL